MPTTELPPVIQGWIRQLTDPALVALVRDWPSGRIDVRLSAARGRVRSEPEVTLGGGPLEMVDPLK
jgi:hypothetical protein